MIEAGLPPDKKDNIQFGKKGTVTIRDLENSLCLALIDKIHGTKPFSRTLYCNGVIPMTPEKNVANLQSSEASSLLLTESTDTQIATSNVDQPTHSVNPGIMLTESSLDNTSENMVSRIGESLAEEECSPLSGNIPGLLSPLMSPTKDEHFRSPTWPAYEAEDLARRHSLSLLNRTPTSGSLAAELLGPNVSHASITHLSTISNVREIMESLSDFNSCLSASSSSEGSEKENAADFKESVKKQKWRKTPNKVEAVKN